MYVVGGLKNQEEPVHGEPSSHTNLVFGTGCYGNENERWG